MNRQTLSDHKQRPQLRINDKDNNSMAGRGVKRLGRALGVLLLILYTGLLQAQTLVSGTVKDTKGHPVPGASVSLKDSYDGAVSDSLGGFRFKTNERGGFTLTVTNIGYNSFE